MNIPEGSTVIVYGQKAVITQRITIHVRTRYYLDRRIKAPGEEFPRDYAESYEIQSYNLI